MTQVPGFGPGTGGNRRNNFNRGLGGNTGALLMALQNRGPQFHKVVGDGQDDASFLAWDPNRRGTSKT